MKEKLPLKGSYVGLRSALGAAPSAALGSATGGYGRGNRRGAGRGLEPGQRLLNSLNTI
jgi:hypothetical protein